MIRTETRRRARALQLLYAWETQGRPPLEDLVPGVGRMVRPTDDVLAGAAAMAQDVIERLPAIDATIARAAEHWRMERIGLPERLVLRLAVLELLGEDVPPRVAIDQALWLTRRFAGNTAVPFVNGVLDRVARELGRL